MVVEGRCEAEASVVSMFAPFVGGKGFVHAKVSVSNMSRKVDKSIQVILDFDNLTQQIEIDF